MRSLALMTIESEIPPFVQWYEGMMLQPHHFQQADLRTQKQLSYHLTRLTPYFFGIEKVTFDHAVLAEGKIRLLEIDGILPDGTIIQYHMDKGLESIEINVNKTVEDLAKARIIYINLPALDSNIALIKGEIPRYQSLSRPSIVDLNTNDNPIEIPSLDHKIKLSVDESLPGCISMPIAKITKLNEAYLLDDYIPPLLQVKRTSKINDSIMSLTGKIREKAYYYMEKLQSQVGTPLSLETANLLRPMVLVLPVLEAHVQAKGLHPFTLYLKLCEVLGQLASFRLTEVPPSLQPYSQYDIWGSFKPVLDTIHKILDTLQRTYNLVSFDLIDSRFQVKMRDSYLNDKLFIGLKAPVSMSEGELIDWMNESIIASETSLESVMLKRVTGAKRKLVKGDLLLDLMPSRGVLVFEVDPSVLYVRPDENLFIFNPADHLDKRPSDIILYLKDTKDKSDRVLT